MRKYVIVAAGVFGSLVVGATVFSAPVAWAAQALNATIVGPLDANGNVKVHEQGTANVSVTNSSLSVAPQAPVADGGDFIGVSCPAQGNYASKKTATALVIHMDAGVDFFQLHNATGTPALFAGPAGGGDASVQLALSRPIQFDSFECNGTGQVSFTWVGNTP